MLDPPLPLRSLQAFEAAARLGSFREASDELGLTPSAISHQIRLIEARFDVRLFKRLGRGVILSREGHRLYAEVHDGFDRLRLAMRGLKGRRKVSRSLEIVKVSTPPSLASKWLLPALPGFLARHPMIDIRVNAQDSRGFVAPDADLAIVYGGAAQWGERAAPLLEDAVQPLCAPGLVAVRRIRKPSDLLAHTLIRTRGNGVSWEEWLRRHEAGVGRIRSIELDPSHVAIEAAVRGLGIVLESDALTQEEIADGRLVVPLPGLEIAAMSYWLRTPRDPANRDSVEIVRAFLFELARKDRG
jgi:LysR family glycine cleavage system transcriptional activator